MKEKQVHTGNNVTVTEEFFVMRDGTALYTKYSVLNNREKCPVIFIRTPYDKEGEEIIPDEYINDPFVKNGYAVVRQHCRGTGNSQGDFVPYTEKNDGLDTLELIRKLPFYNGEIYLVGKSYLATAHYSYLSEKPGDVKGAVFNIQTDRMYFRNYRNGCCWNYCNFSWWLRRLARRYPEQNEENVLKRPYRDIIKRALGEDVPEFTNNLLNDKYNDFWKNDSRTNLVDNIDFPVLFCDGWYDYYIDGTFSMWERLPKHIKEKSAYVIGPWGHATSTKDEFFKNGNIPDDFAYEWINAIRNNTPVSFGERGKITYYSIGADRWANKKIPLNSESMKLYFTSDDKLNNTPDSGTFTYEYDPDLRPEIMDKTKIEENETCEGVLTFISDEFEKAESFFGRINLNMLVSSDCEDTAFYARIFMVENNTAYYLTETISSLSHINENYIPNTKLKLNIDFSPIAFTINKGGKIRVDISSVSPKYVPHPNVKGHWATVTKTKTAHNSLFCESSFITLPRDTLAKQ